jgi:putative flippase GtrA
VHRVLQVKRWIADPVETLALQMPRALLASLLALALDFCVLEICLRVLSMPAVPAAIAGYLAGGVLQYVLCSVWVFSTSLKNDTAGFGAFMVLSLVGLGITWVVIEMAHRWAGFPIELAKFTAVSLAFTWNFLSRKFLLFRPENTLLASDARRPPSM